MLALLVAVTLQTACQPGADRTVSLGTLERDRIELVAESNEPITRVPVQEGDVVEIGATLIEQDASRAQVALARARADEAAARSALREAEAGPRQQQIAQARARLEASESAVQTARADLDRELALLRRRLTSQNRVDALQGAYDAAVARRAEAQAALDELLEGTRSEQVDQVRARHAAARARVQELEITLSRATTRAPVTGTVEALPFEIGERPPPAATVVVLLASGRVYARVHVSAPLRAQLPPQAPALVWMEGRSEPLPAHLRWIGAQAAYTPYFALNQHDRSRLSYLAEVDLEDPDDALPVGIPVEVTFPGTGQ